MNNSKNQIIIKEEHAARVNQYYKDNDNENTIKVYTGSNDIKFNIDEVDKIITRNSKMLKYDLKIKPEIFIFLHNIHTKYKAYDNFKNRGTLKSLNKEIEATEKLARLFLDEDLKENNDRTNINMKEIVFSINGKDVKIVMNAKKNEETTIEAKFLLFLLNLPLLDKIYYQITERKEFLTKFVQKFKDNKGSKPTDQRVNKAFIKNEVKPFYNFLCDHIETKSSIYLFLVEILKAIGFDTDDETIKRGLLE